MNDPGQVVHTHVPLSESIQYGPNLVLAKGR